MDLAYVCEWEKWPRSTHCPSVPLACAWSCRNLIAFTTDLRNDDQGVSPHLQPSSLSFLSSHRLPQYLEHCYRATPSLQACLGTILHPSRPSQGFFICNWGW